MKYRDKKYYGNNIHKQLRSYKSSGVWFIGAHETTYEYNKHHMNIISDIIYIIL